jgi:hypothetical protein
MTNVANLPLRPPQMLAKASASLDLRHDQPDPRAGDTRAAPAVRRRSDTDGPRRHERSIPVRPLSLNRGPSAAPCARRCSCCCGLTRMPRDAR